MTVAVIVVAAGSGERLGSGLPKAFVQVAGTTLLEHSLEPLTTLGKQAEIVVVAPSSWMEPARELAERVVGTKASVAVVSGGATRTDSVRAGLVAVSDKAQIVLVHDAARAFTPAEVFDRVIGAVEAGSSGVIPVLDVTDTIVPVDDSSLTSAAFDRTKLRAVQTPQGFDAATLRASYDAFSGDATDDAEVLRHAGHEVMAVPGHPDSHKITYPTDLVAAERTFGHGAELRVGTAVDVHQFDDASALVLGGMNFEGPGLSGHSDGDVILHVITDALLSAAGLGDLGTHFGTDRPEFEGVKSEVFVTEALRLLTEAGFSPRSMSVQYIGNTPRLGGHREAMGQHLSALVGCPVHLSATTSDGLGLTGRGEGAAALATALVSPSPLPRGYIRNRRKRNAL